jgi:glutamine amidotransferase-like uncharacterized protein
MPIGKALVYAGKGSSHSWTWTADLLESRGVFDAEFVDSEGLVSGTEDGASLVVISGGDGFEIARALVPKGFNALERFVRAGGTYFGACAGAYLPLPSRIEPLSGFNVSSTKIRNLALTPDEAAESSPRTGVRYGSCSIVHPVRGEVVIGSDANRFIAPIYGGPIFAEPDSDSVMMRYLSFTDSTSFQVERSRAEEMMMGAPAVVLVALGDGTMVLAGPHLEHPGYPEANSVFMHLTGMSHGDHGARAMHTKMTDRSVVKSLADLKVAVLGAERESFLVGAKLWDGGRMLELAQAIDRRKGSMDGDAVQAVVSLLDAACEDLLSMGPRRVADSDSAPAKLVEAARLCVNCHFEFMRR